MTRWGGVERMLVDLLLNVEQKQVQHHLLATSSIPEIMKTVQQAGIQTFQPKRRFHYDPGAILQMVQWLRANDIDVVHTYNIFANCWGGVAAMLAQVPVLICGEHGTVWNSKPPMRWIEKWIYQQATKIVANSQASVCMLELRQGIKRDDRLHVVHNAVMPLPEVNLYDIRSELNVGVGDIVIGSVGRLDTPKNFFVLIDAARLIVNEHPDIKFVIIGGGPLEQVLRQYVSSLEMENNFFFTGWRADARRLLQIFDLFVCTSVRETFGNVLVEAALAGIPAIAPRIDGIPEAVVDQKTGILLTPTEVVDRSRFKGSAPLPKYVLIDEQLQPPRSLNPRRLAKAILDLLARPDLCSKYGEMARERAVQEFSIKRYCQELELIYLREAKNL